jgi:hypothetical protein
MLPVLVTVALLLSAADHWTTYLCLSQEAPGVEVSEGNPLAAWLFTTLGLTGGLVVDTLVTVAALAFLAVSDSVPRWVKYAFLCGLIGATTLAVANNLGALTALRLAPFGLPS